jgi:hypothetical protein
MKPRNRHCRSLNVSNSRWMAYAVAGLASASGGAAEGAIHYTDPANVILRGDDRATFALNDLGDKLVFQHHNHASHPPALGWAGFSVVGLVSVSVRGRRIGSTFSFVSNLRKSSLVSHGYLRPNGGGTLAIFGGGEFQELGIGFIGFAFNNGSGKQYGWARVQMGGREPKNAFKVLDYAYADPGEPIEAGQTSDEPVTGMGSLGLLAAGAVGLTAWRKSRRSVSSAAP